MNPTIITDLRSQLTSTVFNQGHRRTCLAIAASQAHQAARGGEPLAPDALWMTAQSSKTAGPRGLTPAQAAAALAQPGQPLLSAMPLETSAHAVIAWPAGIASEPWFSAHMKTDSGTDAIRAALAANQIVILGIEVTNALLDLTTSDGVVDADPTRQRFYELHAVICVGSGRSAADDELFLIRNSWGPSWADGGDGWVTAAFLDEHCRDVMEVDDVYP